MKCSKTQFLVQAVSAGLVLTFAVVEPASASIGDGLANQVKAILEPLLLVCAAIMGFGAMLKGDWKTLLGCILMLLIVGSLIYGDDAWVQQIRKFAEGIGGA
jgi:type III secretory pathway component EscV